MPDHEPSGEPGPPASRPGFPPDADALAGVVERLGHWCGRDLDPFVAREAAAEALRLHPGGDSRLRQAQLLDAAERCGLVGQVIRVSTADAAWHAAAETPLAVWIDQGHPFHGGAGWLILVRRGPFHVKIDGAQPGQDPRRLSAGELARLLGGGPGTPREFVLVQPGLPAADAGVHGAAEKSGHPAAEAGATGAHGEAAGGHAHLHPFRRLFALIRLERADLWALLWYAIMAGVLYLAIPLAVDALVSNIAFGGQQRAYLQALGILAAFLLAFLLLYAAVRALAFVAIERLQRRMFVRFTADLAYRLPRVQQSHFDRQYGPELTNRFFDIMTMQKASAQLLLDGLDVALTFLAGGLILAFYDWTLFWFDAGLLLLVVLAVWGLGKGGVQTSIEESRAKYATAGWLQQIAMFTRVFKGVGGPQLARQEADRLARWYLVERRRHFRVLFRQVIALLAIEVLASVVLLSWGGLLVLQGKLSLGQLVASELILTATVGAMAKFGKQLESAYDLLTAIDKVGYLVDLETERQSGETPAPGSPRGASLRVQDVSFSYDGHHPVFSGVSFSVDPGGRLALVWPSGAGASSLLDLMYGLREPTRGHIDVDGLDLRNWHPYSLRIHAALVRDHEDIVEGSVVDNIRFGDEAIGRPEVREALAGVGLLDGILALPGGLDARLQIGGRQLSTTQRHQLLLARAVVSSPRLLLLDGTLDGLDSHLRKVLMDFLFDPRRPWTLVVVTRDPEVIARCDRVVHLPEHANPSSHGPQS